LEEVTILSKLSQTMAVYCPSSGSWKYVPFYTTTEEAGAYGSYGNAIVGGVNCYYPLGPASNGYATDLKVIK
jgi:hypothetical protein